MHQIHVILRSFHYFTTAMLYIHILFLSSLLVNYIHFLTAIPYHFFSGGFGVIRGKGRKRMLCMPRPRDGTEGLLLVLVFII